MTENFQEDAALVTSRAEQRRVAISSCTGTTIEFYDFLLFGTAAALVFPDVFFPALGSAAGAVASLSTLGVAFVARPVGAVIFGHFGDRIGRKNTLVATLVLMGVATVLIGFVPSADTIGVAAPLILVTLRFLQGLAVGGEWAGATLLAAEYAPPGKRGLFAVFPQLGTAFGFGLASGTFLLVDQAVGPDSPEFLAWGWRIPFVGSAVLVLIGLYVRLTIAETPVFREYRARSGGGETPAHASLPFREVLRAQWREVLLGGGVMTVIFALFYIATAYMTSFGTSESGAQLSRSTVLILGIAASAGLAATTIIAGILSDRYGRRRTILLGYGLTVPIVAVLFWWLAGGSVVAFGVTLSVILVLYGIAYGPLGAYLPELFRTEYRYTGAGLAYNLGGILGGAVVPPVASVIAASYGVSAVGALLAVVGIFSLMSTLALRGRSRSEDNARL